MTFTGTLNSVELPTCPFHSYPTSDTTFCITPFSSCPLASAADTLSLPLVCEALWHKFCFNLATKCWRQLVKFSQVQEVTVTVAFKRDVNSGLLSDSCVFVCVCVNFHSTLWKICWSKSSVRDVWYWQFYITGILKPCTSGWDMRGCDTCEMRTGFLRTPVGALQYNLQYYYPRPYVGQI